MKKIFIIFLCSLLITSICIAETDYPVPQSISDGVLDYNGMLLLYMEELHAAASDAVEKDEFERTEVIKEMAYMISDVSNLFFMLDKMLKIERAHGEANQYNHEAIYFVKRSIDTVMMPKINQLIRSIESYLQDGIIEDNYIISRYKKLKSYFIAGKEMAQEVKAALPK